MAITQERIKRRMKYNKKKQLIVSFRLKRKRVRWRDRERGKEMKEKQHKQCFKRNEKQIIKNLLIFYRDCWW